MTSIIHTFAVRRQIAGLLSEHLKATLALISGVITALKVCGSFTPLLFWNNFTASGNISRLNFSLSEKVKYQVELGQVLLVAEIAYHMWSAPYPAGYLIASVLLHSFPPIPFPFWIQELEGIKRLDGGWHPPFVHLWSLMDRLIFLYIWYTCL